MTASTVSRVLNKKPSFSTSPEVRRKIEETAEQLGYVPDLAARNLSRRTTRVVGLFASPATHVSEGIYEPLIEGVLEALHASDYDVFFDLSASRGRRLPFWRFDGALLLQCPRPETVEELDRRRVPYVCVNETVGSPVVRVLADDAMGMRRAVEHLTQLGHLRLAYANARATYLPHYSVADRHEALLRLSNDFGFDLVGLHDAPFADAKEFVLSAVVDQGATAVITYDHQIAVAIVGAAAGLELRIPEDFSLLCFNDVFPVSLMPSPLTAVSVPAREMGRVSGRRLLDDLAKHGASEAKEIRLPEELVVRRSTAPPPREVRAVISNWAESSRKPERQELSAE